MIVSYGGFQLDDSKTYFIKPADLWAEGSIACRDAPNGLMLIYSSVDDAQDNTTSSWVEFGSPNVWKKYYGSNWDANHFGFNVVHGTGEQAGRAFSLRLVGKYNGTKPVYLAAFDGPPTDAHGDYTDINRMMLGSCFVRATTTFSAACLFSACAAGTASGMPAAMVRCFGEPDKNLAFWGCTAYTDFNDSRTPNPLPSGSVDILAVSSDGKAVYNAVLYPRLVPTKLPLPNNELPTQPTFRAPDGGYTQPYKFYATRATKMRFVFDTTIPS